MHSAEYWIHKLDLQPHPEGGFYRETYRSEELIPHDALPARFPGPRACSTAICFLLRSGEISTLHRIKSDELWHFHTGAPLTIHTLTDEGAHDTLRLGLDLADGRQPQLVVPAGTWFGACVDEPHSFALVGCTVAPGFDFADLELAKREELLALFPDHADLIRSLTPAP
jgi:predicted cupin superfamily sugar epimerase